MGAGESTEQSAGPVPQSFLCPITGGIMEDPVRTSDGYVYERASIEAWLRSRKRTSPQTGEELASLQITSCEPLRRAIEEYMSCRVELERRPVSESVMREAAFMLDKRSRAKASENETRRASFEQLRALAQRLTKAAQSFPDTNLRAETREVAELLDIMISAVDGRTDREDGRYDVPEGFPPPAHRSERRPPSPVGSDGYDPEAPLLAPRKALDCIGGLSLVGNKYAVFGVQGPGSKQMLDLNDDRCIRTLVGHEQPVQSVVALPDGQVATASDDKTVRTWECAAGHWLSTYKGHERSVCGLALGGEGRLVTCSFDSSLKVWHLATAGGAPSTTLRGHQNSVQCVTPLGENTGLVASGSADKSVRIWDLSTSSCVGTIIGHEKKVRSLSALSGKLLASGSWDSTVRIWDVEGGRCAGMLEGHTRRVWSVVALAEDKLASCASDKEVRIWDVGAERCLMTLKGHKKDVTCVVKLDERRIVTCSLDQTVRVWDIVNGVEAMPMLRGHKAGVLSACVLGERSLASGSLDATAKIWDLRI